MTTLETELRCFFSVRLLSVLRGHSVLSFPPQRPMTSDLEGFSIPDFIHYIYFPILILEKELVFPFLMFSAKQGNYGHTQLISMYAGLPNKTGSSECWLRVREVPGSIPSQGPPHTKEVIKMVPVVPLFSTRH